MKSLQLATAGNELIERDIPQPKPGPGEVSVRVYAAGVTPTELSWYPTAHAKSGEPRLRAVPAHEFSGEIAELGEGSKGVSIGEAVYGMNDWFADGALADYCITRPEWIALKPRHLTHAEAASVPIGALTAWQGLFDRADLQARERVLIHGGAGAVGVFAIQLARRRGAYVITTVSALNAEFAKSLGASEVIDYKTVAFEKIARDIDVVFDTVGGDTLQRSWDVLKPGGRMVTVASNSESTSDERVTKAFFIVEAKREQLMEISRLLDARELRTVVDITVPFSRAAEAYAGSVKRQGRGKMVVIVGDAAKGQQGHSA